MSVFSSSTLNQFVLSNNTYLTLFSYFSLLTFLILSNTHGEEYTKDVNEIKRLYNIFLNNYTSLNQEFAFNNAIEIYAMYEYLLHEGYLSKDHNFKFSSSGYYDIKRINGIHVINGVGVCRHVSALLTDILKSSNIISSEVICRLNNDSDIMLLNQLKEYILKETNEMHLLKKIDKKIKIIQKENQKVQPYHMISYTEEKGVSYLFDATNSKIYLPSKEGILISKSDTKITLNKKVRRILEEYNAYNNTVNMIDTLDIKDFFNDLEKKTETVRTTCTRNIDILEKFYKENQELYDEISEKYNLIKKRKIK